MQALKAVWTVPALILTAFVLLGNVVRIAGATSQELSLIHISEPTRPY